MKHVLGAVLVAGCAIGLIGCDEIVTVTNQPPEIEPVGRCELDGRTYLVLRLIDRESDPIDLAIAYDGDGGCPPAPGGLCAVQTGPTGDGLSGLQSEPYPPGTLHRIEWVDPADVASLRVTATDDDGERAPVTVTFDPIDDCAP